MCYMIIFCRFNWTCSFIVSLTIKKFFNSELDIFGTYFMYGAICLLAFFFVIFILPETKGKTNDDMKDYYMKRAGRSTSMTGMVNPNFDDKA